MAIDSVRKILNQQGIDNSRIGWNNGMVQIDNKDFYKPAKVLAGTSYGDPTAVNQALQTFNRNNMYQGGIFQPASSDPWQKRLVQYASDPNAGYAELDRIGKVINAKTAVGDTAGVTDARDWLGKVNASIGVTGQANPYDRQVSTILTDLQSRINNPTPYDPYSSPEYAAAKAEQERRAGYATRQTQEALGESGFARSTNLTDRVQRIQNDANEYLATQIAPQLISANEAKRQQGLSNLMSLVSAIQGQQKTYDTRQQAQLENEKLQAEINAKADEQKRKQLEADLDAEWKIAEETGTITPKLAKLTGLKVGTKTLKAIKQLQDRQDEQARIAISRANLGVAQGNLTLRGKELEQKSKEEISRKESADNYGQAFGILDDLAASDPKKKTALDWLKQNKANFNDQDYKALVNYINSKDSPFE